MVWFCGDIIGTVATSKTKKKQMFVPSSYFKVDEVPKLGTGKADFKGAKKLALELLG